MFDLNPCGGVQAFAYFAKHVLTWSTHAPWRFGRAIPARLAAPLEIAALASSLARRNRDSPCLWDACDAALRRSRPGRRKPFRPRTGCARRECSGVSASWVPSRSGRLSLLKTWSTRKVKS